VKNVIWKGTAADIALVMVHGEPVVVIGGEPPAMLAALLVAIMQPRCHVRSR
jgi:hypothetical protein